MSESRPTIAILGGGGSEGSGLAFRWSRAGYRVIIGSRDAGKAASFARAIYERTGTEVSGYANTDAAKVGDIVVLTVPYSAQRALAEEVAVFLEGKIVIDVTVPLMPPKVARVQLPQGGSAVEALQQRLGTGVRVVSAFQNVSAHQLSDPDHDVDCDVLVSGDDEGARDIVCKLAGDIGLRAWQAGPLANSAAAEALTSVLIFINKRYNVAKGSGIRISGIENSAQ
ncbi:NADPH-dependent F420 reductase [Phyllobacterium sp. YR531]|uniref:NADPH-dependent F420 reductase n=1 Tax=Phyllobacterium sp. YR531 TaxID=1144343 RepID=UPI00026FB1F6|nr:NADPH-dependent F420 reductase [Phyllobacterium sp. YR531]EJN05831.1 NADPH-dependent reductase [Phyllobacterium sp. YR531]